jgi:hypothetical protein
MRHDSELEVHCMNRWELKLNAEDAFRYEDIFDNFDALWDQANLLLSDPTPRLLGTSPSQPSVSLAYLSPLSSLYFGCQWPCIIFLQVDNQNILLLPLERPILLYKLIIPAGH